MRPWHRLRILPVLGMFACSGSSDEPPTSGAALAFPPPKNDTPAGVQGVVPPSVKPAERPAPPTALNTLTEVVYVFQRDHDGGNWMCTGTLVAKDLVVTAAHCLDPEKFALFQ